MHVTIRSQGIDRCIDVPEGQTIARAANEQGLHLLGSCSGHNACGQCSFRVKQGIDQLLRKDGTPYVHEEGYAHFVRTCQMMPASDGVVTIDADDRARRW